MSSDTIEKSFQNFHSGEKSLNSFVWVCVYARACVRVYLQVNTLVDLNAMIYTPEWIKNAHSSMKSSLALYFFPHHYIHLCEALRFFCVLFNFDENTFFHLFNVNKARSLQQSHSSKKIKQFAFCRSIERLKTSRKRNTTIFFSSSQTTIDFFFFVEHSFHPSVRTEKEFCFL